jgi:FtsH-binding integral membrane protein
VAFGRYYHRDEMSTEPSPPDSGTEPPARPRMPFGIRLFLAYTFLILAGIGLSLRFVVDQAISAPVSLTGVVVMVLLAYTIFTATLVLQRKQAAFALAVGLASLTIPLVVLLAVSPVHPALPFLTAALGLLLFRGLLRPEVRTYLSEP